MDTERQGINHDFRASKTLLKLLNNIYQGCWGETRCSTTGQIARAVTVR